MTCQPAHSGVLTESVQESPELMTNEVWVELGFGFGLRMGMGLGGKWVVVWVDGMRVGKMPVTEVETRTEGRTEVREDGPVVEAIQNYLNLHLAPRQSQVFALARSSAAWFQPG